MAADPPLLRLLRDAARALDLEVRAALEDRGVVGLSSGHAATLMLVGRSGARLTDLAGQAGVTKQSMMQMIDGLESAGLVRRVADPEDARAKTVRLTARGLRTRAEARRAISSVEGWSRRHLGDRRYEALRGALADLLDGSE